MAQTRIVLVCERTTAECPSLFMLRILAKLAGHDSGIDGLGLMRFQTVSISSGYNASLGPLPFMYIGRIFCSDVES